MEHVDPNAALTGKSMSLGAAVVSLTINYGSQNVYEVHYSPTTTDI